MSLLIDALKKHRQESASVTTSAESSVATRIPISMVKKLVLIGSITVIVVSLTAIISFLIFKHVEKKRITQMTPAQKVNAFLATNVGDATPGSAEAAVGLRAKLQQKMEQAQANNTQEAAAAETANTVSPAPAEDASVAHADAATQNAAASVGTLRDHLAQRTALNQQNNAEASADTSSNDQASSSSASDDSSATDTTNDQASSSSAGDDSSATDTTNDQTSSSSAGDDSSTTDTATIDTANDQSNNGSSTVDDNTSDDDATSAVVVNPVDIQVVPNQLGANNSIYQKALSYMQKNQYNQALPLLQDNDDLLLKTQGLSALLLARIYLSTGQYVLANIVLDRALMLHAGSDVELIGLKAQVFFMQKQYQEAVDVLSTQSPDLSVYPEYYTLLADAYMHINQPANAASVFEQIVARFPDSANYWLGLAVAYQKNGDANSALVAYHRAAQLSPDDPQVILFINHQIEALQVR
jgi:tetratricopeptide (TPR) repeat protein